MYSVVSCIQVIKALQGELLHDMLTWWSAL